MKKIPLIPLMEYNVIMSLLDYFNRELNNYDVDGKKISVVASYSDIKNKYKVPALSIEILYRKNRSIGFGNFYGDAEMEINNENKIVEIDGTLLEYRIQFNVYSNTRGDNYKWCSILDEVLKNSEQSIPINAYDSRGNIVDSKVGNISYDYASDVKNNSFNPNIETYDHHTIYELKALSLQKYTITYDMMELGNIIGKLK